MRARQCSKSLLILFGAFWCYRLFPAKQSFLEARPAGFEPATRGLEVRWYIDIPAQWRKGNRTLAGLLLTARFTVADLLDEDSRSARRSPWRLGLLLSRALVPSPLPGSDASEPAHPVALP